MSGNWKTTVTGLASIAIGIFTLLKLVLGGEGDPSVAIAAITAGVTGLLASDSS